MLVQCTYIVAVHIYVSDSYFFCFASRWIFNIIHGVFIGAGAEILSGISQLFYVHNIYVPYVIM